MTNIRVNQKRLNTTLREHSERYEKNVSRYMEALTFKLLVFKDSDFLVPAILTKTIFKGFVPCNKPYPIL